MKKSRKGEETVEVDYKAIGQRIKIARIKKGVTQETVADLIDITPAHMSNVETGKNQKSVCQP